MLGIEARYIGVEGNSCQVDLTCPPLIIDINNGKLRKCVEFNCTSPLRTHIFKYPSIPTNIWIFVWIDERP